MTKVYVYASTTESGDAFLYVWAKRPTFADIQAVIDRDMPEEDFVVRQQALEVELEE